VPEFANAYPTKHFFFEMFTRDISLEDCVLDLIDNSLDSLIRLKAINLPAEVLEPPRDRVDVAKLPSVDVTWSDKEVRVVDNCGGIPVEFARADLFTFGHREGFEAGVLGAYGVGLKRAIFKIGNRFEMKSFTDGNGFRAYLDDVKEWSTKDKTLDQWKIPMEPLQRHGKDLQRGTEIVIGDLHEPVKGRMKSGTFIDKLWKDIAQTYSLLLGRYARVTVNGKMVEPKVIPLGESEEVKPAKDEFQEHGVRVTLIVGFAPRRRTTEDAGWHLLCNGRVVVPADKTDLTGWVSPTIFHDKYRGFLGLAFFHAEDPLALPWTTTKRGINRESLVFQSAVNRMRILARPVLKTLSDFYPPGPLERPQSKEITESVKVIDVREMAAKPSTAFKVEPIWRELPPTVRVQYDALREDVERVKKHLRRPRMSATEVGKYTFEHFVKKECPK
jgi:hypothetical protein